MQTIGDRFPEVIISAFTHQPHVDVLGLRIPADLEHTMDAMLYSDSHIATAIVDVQEFLKRLGSLRVAPLDKTGTSHVD